VKLIFTGIVFAVFYTQLQKIDWKDLHAISMVQPISLVSALLLAFVNHYLEYRKWKATLSFLEESTQTVQSYLAGVLTGFLTPSLLGNFIGRMYYYPRKKRTQIIVLTFLGNGAQFLASISFGLLAVALLGQEQLHIPRFNSGIALGVIALMLLIYFLFDKSPVPIQKWKTKIIPLLVGTEKLRFKILLFSLLRYLVFSMQYSLLFHAFGIPFSIDLVIWVWQIYFWSTLAPSLWLGKLFIRESIALWILLPIIGHPEIILLSSVSLWIINHGITALIALPFFKKQVKC
jgi:hypothetical protein